MKFCLRNDRLLFEVKEIRQHVRHAREQYKREQQKLHEALARLSESLLEDSDLSHEEEDD